MFLSAEVFVAHLFIFGFLSRLSPGSRGAGRAEMEGTEERLIRLETDLSYIQDTLRELNDIVSQQQILVSKLEKQNAALAKKIEDMDTEARPNSKPPHY